MRPVADALPGGHLIGKFELREPVWRSPTGIVYRAWDRDLGFAVAIKEHLPSATAKRQPSGDVAPASPSDSAAYASSLQGFIRVSRALAHCDHPALVRVLQLQFAHGTAYRVMPWIDAEPLLDARRRLPRLPDERSLRELLDHLLGALEAFHRTGNVHGSVHPTQILLRTDGRPLLLGPADDAAAAGGVAEPRDDLHGLAAVARLWMGGAADRPSQHEPARANGSERLALNDRGLRFGRAFLATIDGAASSDPAQWPASVAEFRERLRDAERADSHAALAVVAARAGPVPALEVLGPEFSIDPVLRPPRLQRAERGPPSPRWAWWGAGAFALVLAAATFGVWQSLLPALPAGIAAALPEMTDPRPVAAPTPAPAAAPVEAAPAPPVAIEAPPPQAAVSVETAPSATPPRSPATPTPQTEPPPPARTGAASPREVCGPRTQFSLYRCMQFQCEQAGWRRHPQCVRFRITDRVE